MKIGARPILVLHGNDRLCDRLSRLQGKEFVVRPADDWQELTEMARAAPPFAVAVVDPYAGASRSFRSLLAEFPSLPVFAAIPATEAYSARVVELSGSGVADIITIDRDNSTEALRERFRQANGRSVKLLLERVLPPGISERAEAILEIAADVAAAGGYIRDVAQTLDISRRTLVRWTAASDLPASRRLLAWLRLLQAAELLDDPGRTVYSVARACGYSSDSSLRRVALRFLADTPTVLRRRGAFAVASAAFTWALDRARSRRP